MEALTPRTARHPPGWRAGRTAIVLLAVALCFAGGPAGRADTGRQAAVARLFARIAADPPRLQQFLLAMAKGGDLHNHLSGAVYAESYLDWALRGGLCVDPAGHGLSAPPCAPDRPALADAEARDPAFRGAMIDALSMRDFVPRPGDASGHDHFFAAFGKFDAAATGNVGASLAEEAHRAASEHVSYLEIIWYPRMREAAALGLSRPFRPDDPAADLADLAPFLPPLLARAGSDTDAALRDMRALLRCGRADADPGCGVTIRFQPFLLRVLPPAAVFAQMAYAVALVRADPRFVGINIVAPEDDPVALRDYDRDMRLFRFFHAAHPELRFSLHAGELEPGLVPPEALRFHIREAVQVAGAARIGHGVDIPFETGSDALLAEMARRGVTVEINQTSNRQILGLDAADHPFALYRAHGVPVVISTDDEGVERIDLSHEYVAAVRNWHLDYPAVKALVRASIADSFLSGAPLALDPDGTPRPPSPDLLSGSDKARAQWTLETELDAFEAAMLRQDPAQPRPR